MHDPDVVAFEIRRPWPQRTSLGRAQSRWDFGRHRNHPWWRPSAWSPFWTLAGRNYYWPALVTIWHREPGGRDTGEVCKHWRTVGGRRKPTGRWRWHVHHWHIQIRPVQALHRFLFERCTECGRRYPYGYAPIAHQSDEPRGPWWRVTRRHLHHECSGLVHLRRDREQLEGLVRRLVAEIRYRADETEEQTIERLTGTGNTAWEWRDRYRLQRLLGYTRDDQYQLVKDDQ